MSEKGNSSGAGLGSRATHFVGVALGLCHPSPFSQALLCPYIECALCFLESDSLERHKDKEKLHLILAVSGMLSTSSKCQWKLELQFVTAASGMLAPGNGVHPFPTCTKFTCCCFSGWNSFPSV